MSESNTEHADEFFITQEWSRLVGSLAVGLKEMEGQRGGSGAQPDEDPWEPITNRADFLQRLATADEFRSTIVTGAGGFGKTITSEWLEYVLTTAYSLAAIRVTAKEVKRQLGSAVHATASKKLQELLIVGVLARHPQPEDAEEEVTAGIRRALREGRLCLILDAIDEVGPDDLELLQRLWSSAEWRNLRVIVTGRPYAVKSRQQSLFQPRTNGTPWSAIKLERFDANQCEIYLKQSPNALAWFQQIRNESGREKLVEVLQIPRVLKYLRKLKAHEFAAIRSATDVVYGAIWNMVAEGLKNTAKARLSFDPRFEAPALPTVDDIEHVIRSLAAAAFLVTSWQDPVGKPNFEGIAGKHPMAEFRASLGLRLFPDAKNATECGKDVERTLERLGDLNFGLRFDLLEAETRSLSEIQFSNRTLQEVLTGVYLAKYVTAAGPEIAEKDIQAVWDQNWLVEWDRDESYAFEPIWLAITDLPRPDPKAPGYWERIDVPSWLQTIELLYRPGWPDTAASGEIVWHARRSPEFIYRSWFTLQAVCDSTGQRGDQSAWRQQAINIRDTFLGEFQELLDGKWGADRQTLARALKDDFVRFDGGEFYFGFENGGFGMLPSQREHWEEHFSHWEDSEEDLERYLLEVVSLKTYGARWRKRYLEGWKQLIRSRGWATVNAWFPRNEICETPAECLQVQPFGLARRPVTNAWLRLFAPHHGRDRETVESYRKISQEDEQPAIYVDWYLAWTYSQWCGCRLPSEMEFEFVAKLDIPLAEQRCRWYWWPGNTEDDFDPARCNGNHDKGKTTIASPDHASPATHRRDPRGEGIMEQFGGVWEWQIDVYRDPYELRADEDAREQTHSARALRGGSWNRAPGDCRLTWRSWNEPGGRNNNTGFRLAQD